MAYTPLPAVPLRTDNPDVFIAKADLFVAALPQLQTDLMQAQSDVLTNTPIATAASNNATAAANTAQAAATATAWVSGTTYALNKVAISQINFQSYRRIIAGAGTTDPASDLTNWVLLYGNDANGSFLPIPVAGISIDLSKGNYFTATVNGAVTFNIINCPTPGYSFTLEVALTSGSVSFVSSVKAPADVIPTLTAGKTHLFMFVTSNSGTRWRLTTAANYVT